VIVTTLEHWRKWAPSYTMLPYIIKLGLAEDRIQSWTKAWEAAAPDSFVLESGKGGRYTFLGLQPLSTIRGNGQEAEIMLTARGQLAPEDQSPPSRKILAKPLEAVKEWMKPYRAPKVAGTPKFLGGCAGFWGYDVIRTIERLPERIQPDLAIPDYCFGMYDRIWILDHEEKCLYIAVHMQINLQAADDGSYLAAQYEQAHIRAEEMLRTWHEIRSINWKSPKGDPFTREQMNIDIENIQGIQAAFDKEDYIHATQRIQSYISHGDVFQINLSVRQSRELQAAPEDIYESLRIVNPSPYMGLLRFSDFALVSGSPELLVALENGTLRTRPIAGTRRRGRDEQEDHKLADELINSEKERAEHVMLVDLQRNDLGRISKYGSVRVDDFMVIEYYSHVMHIVSEVVGELAEDKDAFDVIAATFPGGTITGAPKIRTMEIIEELEPVRRGPYTGSMGWIDYNGNMEFNIIIRTLVAVEGIGHVQAGAGIVIDSIPEREYMESLNKAKALWKAIEISEQSMSRA
jgi:para-aminobenzoate synthetase component 1